ncbi:hypothetical protein A3A76_04705 [Candidatus Woesebacteria bacterium RIFCSPLOWO2_01_FULL_39_23]|uniref:Bacteriocin-protection protein, YdeI/OmpD-associated family n=2 Tax=Microgenomates group TaxID=1794810 RepID=A0A0H4T717_9BACT|nr:hypothetical protein [uncultured Microgenomates bacterium Rifle_16ft_4_minimus_37633]OGM13784.1 MAG: hypothetical protein A2141_03930 [Candidatus Woesebacteria bacterium RBG_16_40_11]OGM27734.1 MAG: hypothetical protein A2628_04925 [Candidatus Woesebacteria bacterium RIFCSPHIGHO2_01_FULL_40_22]OGM38677.1 MAG: hypothetical protein A3E41_00110 [Candidatus Woesebacteria bacterium RIFCSPHIGHO2_12_FULL_38_9]OGM62156.1 MAG: hypothetical protein A3A76_04705 [Candidatus Woesebacteria bacterium RIFCS
MNIGKTLSVENRKGWRVWLRKNHRIEKDIWLEIYKKHANRGGITYEEAVEEALCFGWIDGIMRRLDDDRIVQRFSPRNPDSVWSLLNKKRALKMIKEGKMTEAGLKTIRIAKKTGKWQAAYSSKTKPTLPPDLKKALIENQIAYTNFNKFSDSIQLAYIFWILAAKRQETKSARIKVVIDRSSKNLKPQ